MQTSTFDHVHPNFREVVTHSDEDRMAFIDQPRWIGYPQAKFIIDTMQGLMSKPAQPRMPNLLIVGESNNGKTTLIERFKSLCGDGFLDENENSVKPLIVAQAPPSPDERGLYVSILDRFWAPYRVTDPPVRLRYQVIQQLRRCKVRLLIIDEFHSLLCGTPVKQREVMNVIKLLCNELCIPIVGVGTRDAVRVLHTDPQHASRFDVVALPLWELTPDFQRLIKGFEAVLPLKRPSGLSAPELASLLHTISEGNLGNLRRLLAECAKEAIRSGEERVTAQIIESKKWLRPTRGIRELAV